MGYSWTSLDFDSCSPFPDTTHVLALRQEKCSTMNNKQQLFIHAGNQPEMVFLILTKILSKSLKSFQEDWNMCMNWFTHRFSMLERRGIEH